MEKYPYKLAKLVDHGRDVTKRWYVDYSAWDVAKEKLVRVRHFSPLNREKNIHRRLQLGEQIVRVINSQLRQGKCLGKDSIQLPKYNWTLTTVGDALKLLIQQKKADNHRPSYVRTFSRLNNIWDLWLAEQEIPDLPIRRLSGNELLSFFHYVQERKVSNKTYNNYRNEFATFLNWMQKRFPGVVKRNPIDAIGVLKVVARKHAALTDAQMKAIQKKCAELGYTQLLLLINFIYYSLTRPGELGHLRIAHIDLEENRIFIPGTISKNRRDEYVAIAPSLRRVILSAGLKDCDPDFYIFGKNQLPGPERPYGNSFWERNVKVLKALKFTDRSYDVYSYKHSGAISLYKATKDIKLLQRQCRHTTIEQTSAYLRDLDLLSDHDGLKDWQGAL